MTQSDGLGSLPLALIDDCRPVRQHPLNGTDKHPVHSCRLLNSLETATVKRHALVIHSLQEPTGCKILWLSVRGAATLRPDTPEAIGTYFPVAKLNTLYLFP